MSELTWQDGKSPLSEDLQYKICEGWTGVEARAYARDDFGNWIPIGHFPTLDEAKVACQADSERCDCDGPEAGCSGQCCGIGNCGCTPEVAMAALERSGLPTTADEMIERYGAEKVLRVLLGDDKELS